MNENNLKLAISALIENILLNYETLKRNFKEAVTKSKLVENVINIYAEKGLKLNENQIDTYRDFAEAGMKANKRFENLIKNQDFYSAGYMLKDNSNLDIMLEKAKKVKKNQEEMMDLCSELIEKSNMILEML